MGIDYRPADWSTLRLASGAAVSAAGQAVAAMLDQSGKGGPAAQTQSARRPASVVGGIGFDGVNDALVGAAALDFSGSDELVFAAVLDHDGTVTDNTVFELGTDVASVAGLRLAYGASGLTLSARGTATASAVHAPPNTSRILVSGRAAIGSARLALRIDGAEIASSSASQGTGNYGSRTLHIGARAGTSAWAKMTLERLILADGRGVSDALLAAVELEIAATHGVPL
ncbi:hypothetical protein [Frigidibacter oleivorans]|uniref:hypothetical protein n=1 Tax=Frigidibacter oleivorans TaxID=2487129 RepID=UPI000F8C66E1|nr:hypothetical protein [Frigidibacter oleivorans]